MLLHILKNCKDLSKSCKALSAFWFAACIDHCCVGDHVLQESLHKHVLKELQGPLCHLACCMH